MHEGARCELPQVTVGVAAFSAQWFEDVGMQTQAGGFSQFLAEDYLRLTDMLRECFGGVVAPGVITNPTKARAALAQYRAGKIDLLLVLHMAWNEDQPLLTLLDEGDGWPVVWWNYHPTGRVPKYLKVDDLLHYCGTVGMLQGSAVMQRRRVWPSYVAGPIGDTTLKTALRECATAAAMQRSLVGMRAGQIAGRCEAMTGTFVDRGALKAQLGVEMEEISAKDYADICARVSSERIRDYVAVVRSSVRECRVGDEALAMAVRCTLALDDLVKQYALGAVAVQDLDPELHQLLGTRPCLLPPESAQCGVPFSAEGDVNTAIGMKIAEGAAHSAGLYSEIFTYDVFENTMFFGHGSVHNPGLADPAAGVSLVPDLEYNNSDACEGAWYEFVFAPGDVTCVSLYDTGQGYRLTAFEGVSLGAPKRIEGYAHAVIRPDAQVGALLEQLLSLGMTQHFCIVPGRVKGALARWCRLANTQYAPL